MGLPPAEPVLPLESSVLESQGDPPAPAPSGIASGAWTWRRSTLLLPLLAGALHFALGLFLLPGWMFSKYPDFARLLVAHRLQPDEGADTSPLYLLLNLAVAPRPLRVLQSLLGSVAVVAVFFIARALFGRVAGWLALALATLAAPLFLYEATLEPDLLILVANVIALALLVTTRDGRRKTAIWAGALLGLSSALRPSNLALLVVAVLWLAWSQRAAGRHAMRVAGATLAAGVLMLAIPLAIVRATVGQQLTATMSVGVMLHICNRPEGNGIGYQSPTLVTLLEQQVRSPDHPDPFHAIYRRFARAAEGQQLTAAACERYWAARTAAFVRHEPMAWLELMWAKFLAFLAGPDAHDIAEVRQAERSLPVPPLLSFRFLTAVGLAGLVASALRRRSSGPLAPYLGAMLCVSLIFCVTSRYALMVVPVWAVLAGAFIEGFWSSRRQPRALALSVAALLVPLAVTFNPGFRDAARVVERGAAAGAAATQMEQAVRRAHARDAEEAFGRAQAAQPLVRMTRDLSAVGFESSALARTSARMSAERYGTSEGPDAWFEAKLLVLAGDCTAAAEFADRAAAQHFFAAVWDVALDGDLLAADCLLQQGDRRGARERIQRSLQRQPGTL